MTPPARTARKSPACTGTPSPRVLRQPARTRIVILDCCFAGQAIEALAGDDGPGLADITHVRGVYTLTATTRNHTAHVPPPIGGTPPAPPSPAGAAGPHPRRHPRQALTADPRRHLPRAARPAAGQGPARAQPARHRHRRTVSLHHQPRGPGCLRCPHRPRQDPAVQMGPALTPPLGPRACSTTRYAPSGRSPGSTAGRKRWRMWRRRWSPWTLIAPSASPSSNA